MRSEIRIYYESIEQANHYIKPIVLRKLNNLNLKIPVSLIKLSGSHNHYAKNIAPILFWKSPDILISIVLNNCEYPLAQIEFSNAVFTEDHELQRFDGLVASAINKCIYIKISPLSKKSKSMHGGNTNFNYLAPFALIFNKFDKIFYHFDWKCDSSGKVILNKEYLSCPESIPEFEAFIEKLIDFVSLKDNLSKEWINDFDSEIIKLKFFSIWKGKIESSELSNMNDLKSSRTVWNKEKNTLTLKLNRFGHAMDPERGMLAYYGTKHKSIESRMVLDKDNSAWYKGTPSEKKIVDYVKNKGINYSIDLLQLFSLGSGLDKNKDFLNIFEKIKINKSKNLIIDISDFASKNYLTLNKALRTILNYSQSLNLFDSSGKVSLLLTWKEIKSDIQYDSLPKITPIKIRDSLGEDDITYITVHDVLKKNKHHLIAVSYPGAQSDRAVLIAPGTGRKQERKYLDIVSYLPNKFSNLQENKGKYSPIQIKEEIENLIQYKNKPDYKKGIKDFFQNFDSKAPEAVKIGVGFWAGKNLNLSKIRDVMLDELDYFVYIGEDMKTWSIWATGNDNLFEIKKGKVSIPKTFEVER